MPTYPPGHPLANDPLYNGTLPTIPNPYGTGSPWTGGTNPPMPAGWNPGAAWGTTLGPTGSAGLSSLYDPNFREAQPRTGASMAPNVASGPAAPRYLTPAKLQGAQQQMAAAKDAFQQNMQDWQTGSTTRNGTTVPNSAIGDTYRAGQIGRGGLARLFRQ